MIDTGQPQLVGKMFYELFRGNKCKLVQELNHRNNHIAYHSSFIEIERKKEKWSIMKAVSDLGNNKVPAWTLVTTRCQHPSIRHPSNGLLPSCGWPW